MSDKTNRKITFPQNRGFFQDLTLRIKLILRLLADGRVNPLLKILPVESHALSLRQLPGDLSKWHAR
jgi:hypothetical protein